MMSEHPLTADQLADMIRGSEPWLDKYALAAHLMCSVRSVDTAKAQGMPHAIIFGRPKFKVSEAEPWLEAHGYLTRHPAHEAA